MWLNGRQLSAAAFVLVLLIWSLTGVPSAGDAGPWEIVSSGCCSLQNMTQFIPTAGWAAEGEQVGTHFGWSVACAGDINRDGYDDVIVGADNWSNGEAGEGCVFVYRRSANGLLESADMPTESDKEKGGVWRFGGRSR